MSPPTVPLANTGRGGATALAVAVLLAQSGASAFLGPEDRLALGRGPGLDAMDVDGEHEFTFARAAYTSWAGGWGPSWSTDYPKADRQFLIGLKRLTRVDAFALERAVRLDDPELWRYPFLYAVEVGRMSLTEEEVLGLRRYLEAGGLLVVDDFWGTWEWQNFEEQIRRVFPNRPVVDLSLDHPLFGIFYDIDELVQVPNVRNGMAGGPTWERDGYVPACRGILDDEGRLMVVINWNTDLGDAWEWAENPYYPLQRSTFAYQLGINLVLYSMTH